MKLIRAIVRSTHEMWITDEEYEILRHGTSEEKSNTIGDYYQCITPGCKPEIVELALVDDSSQTPQT